MILTLTNGSRFDLAGKSAQQIGKFLANLLDQEWIASSIPPISPDWLMVDANDLFDLHNFFELHPETDIEVFGLLAKHCEPNVKDAVNFLNKGKIATFENSHEAMRKFSPDTATMEDAGFLYVDWEIVERDMGFSWKFVGVTNNGRHVYII